MLLRTDVPMPVLEGQRNLTFESGVATSFNFSEIELRREDVIAGLFIVSATMEVMPHFGGAVQFTKTVTTIFTADGVILDTGVTSGEASARFDLSIAELTSVVPRAFLVTVTDTLGRETRYDSGYLLPILSPPVETAVNHVVISPTELLDIPLGAVVQMGAAAYDASDNLLPGRVITFSSSDDAIATVNAIGTVTTGGLGPVTITAASGGKQAHAQLSVSANVVLLSTFTDADGTDLDGWACDTGQVGVAQTMTWAIDGNHAFSPIYTSRAYYAWETGVADGTITLALAHFFASDLGGLWVRSSDASNGFLAVADNTVYHFYRREAGSFTSLGTGGTPSDGDAVSVAMVGSGFSIRANGVEVIAATDAFNATATKHGLTSGSDLHRFGTFMVAI